MSEPTASPSPAASALPRGSRWAPLWGFRVPGFMARREPRLDRLEFNPVYHLLALEARCRRGNWHQILALLLIASAAFRIFAYTQGLRSFPRFPVWLAFPMIIAGAILFRVGARREKPIAWTTLAPLWTEALQTAPITTGEILCALWGAACRRSRVIGMAILAAGVFGGSVAFTVSESPIFVILQWGAALYAGFVSVVWLSPYPAMAQCRAITRIAQPGVRGVGMRVLSVIVLVVVIYAVLAIAIMGMMRIFELVNSGRIDLTPLTRALQFCASLDPWIRVVIAAGMAVAANRLVTWHYQKRFPRHWAAAMENLRKYMRSDSPKFISMTR